MEIKAQLIKPYTENERLNFIVEQNHKLGYEIRQVETTYEVEIKVPSVIKETITETIQVPVLDENDNPILDEDGNPTFEEKTVEREVERTETEIVTEEIQEPIYDEEGKPVLDDEGNPTYETKTIEKEVTKYKTEIVEKTGYNLEAWGNTDDEKLKQAQQSKLQEASDKAFEYRNVTGLISFNARPVDTSLLEEGESTLILHTELLNQNDFFQRMVGFNSGLYTGDIVYNTKEDILVYLNAEETQAIYYAIIDRAGRLWNEDYMTYKALIEGCTTAEEVEQIVIDYDNVPVIEDEVTDENTTYDNESNVPNELDTTTGQSNETDTDKTE